MNKKLALLGLALVMVGCSNEPVQQKESGVSVVEDTIGNDGEKEEKTLENNSLTTIKIVEQVIGEPIGDRTADNVGQENGEYFAIGSDIVKCSDYTNNSLTTIKIVEQVIGEPIGDRTADNVGQENGEYFAIGSDIVKCSDYTNAHIVVELTNNREELFKSY